VRTKAVTENDEHPNYRRIGWRKDAAEQICKLLTCGPAAYRDVGIDPVERVIDILLGHKCVHDPVRESAFYRDSEAP